MKIDIDGLESQGQIRQFERFGRATEAIVRALP